MNGRGARAIRTLCTLAAVAAAGLGGAFVPTPAYAEEPVALVEVTLESMTPALPARDSEITLTGTATNITGQPILRAQAYFWRNQAPITDREGFDQALGSESNDPIGSREVTGYQNLYEDDDPYLQPGETSRFTLKASVAQLELSPTDGVYLMGVHILQNNNTFAVGRARVLVPVVTTPPKNQLQLTSLITLNSRPSLVRTGVLADDHLAREVAPNGRLTKLLAAADADNQSYAVDPALVEELQTMSGGYSVLNGDGGTLEGPGAADATRWLQGFATLQGRRDGYRLLYGSPDLAALVHGNQRAAIRATAAASRGVAATRRLPLLVLPTGGRADEATVLAATELEPRAIVLTDRSAAGPGPLLVGPGRAPIISVDAAVAGGGPGPDPRDTAVQLRQRLLAETWVEAIDADAAGAARGRVRLITNLEQASRAYAGAEAPWLAASPLSTLLRSAPAAWPQVYAYPDETRDNELSAGQLTSLRRFTTAHLTYADLLVSRQRARSAANAAVARAASGTWRRQDREWQGFLGPQQSAIEELARNAVQIRSAPKVSTIDQQGVVFPITVRNTLPRGTDPDENAVGVRLVFSSDNERRLTIKSIEVPRLRAEENFTADAEVTAKANGIVPVTAQLYTASGRKVGKPISLQVQVTQNGTTGWAIAIGAGAVLIGSTALRIRTVARERAKDAATLAAAGPPSALTSAPPVDAPAQAPAEVAELAVASSRGAQGGPPPESAAPDRGDG